jgi:hypothetical protein
MAERVSRGEHFAEAVVCVAPGLEVLTRCIGLNLFLRYISVRVVTVFCQVEKGIGAARAIS